MAEFKMSASNYVIACATDPVKYASVSMQTAADALFMTRANIAKLVDKGELETVTVDRNRRILVSSLAPKVEAQHERDEKIMKLLVKVAKNPKREPIFYAPVMAEIGMHWQNPPNRKAISIILDRLSRRSYRKHGHYISVLVHRSTPTPTTPGPGFFSMLADVAGTLVPEDEQQAWLKREMKKVFDFYQTK